MVARTVSWVTRTVSSLLWVSMTVASVAVLDQRQSQEVASVSVNFDFHHTKVATKPNYHPNLDKIVVS